jgi:hypothetical protein
MIAFAILAAPAVAALNRVVSTRVGDQTLVISAEEHWPPPSYTDRRFERVCPDGLASLTIDRRARSVRLQTPKGAEGRETIIDATTLGQDLLTRALIFDAVLECGKEGDVEVALQGVEFSKHGAVLPFEITANFTVRGEVAGYLGRFANQPSSAGPRVRLALAGKEVFTGACEGRRFSLIRNRDTGETTFVAPDGVARKVSKGSDLAKPGLAQIYLNCTWRTKAWALRRIAVQGDPKTGFTLVETDAIFDASGRERDITHRPQTSELLALKLPYR